MEAKKLNPTPELQLVAGTKHEGYILHPVLDVLMVGGLGIIFFLGMHFFVPISSDTNKLGWLMFYASFVINYPHFMASYIHMYKDYRKEIFTNWKFTWAGVVAPILLISALLGLSYYAKAQNNNLIFVKN